MKLALVGSYDEACGVASYVVALEQGFKDQFDIRIFNLKTADLVGHETFYNSEEAEAHIDSICEELPKFDCVNLQLEWGLYGRNFDVISRRLIKLIKASRSLILTLHSIQISDDSRGGQYAVFQTLKERPSHLPYWFITHLPREADFLRRFFGIANVTDFPVTYFTEQGVRDLYARTDAKAWKKRLGFREDDIVILHAGFFASHKDHMTALKALHLLPLNYKLVFAGGEHPPGIQKYAISPVVKRLADFIDQYDELALKARNHQASSVVMTLGDRVRFLCGLSDDDMHKTMCCSDIVAITHLESGQSSSGIASMALQLERPTILSYNRFFLEYEKYYKGGFSFFTMGNHYELRDKIVFFDSAQIERLKEYNKTYSLDTMLQLYQKIYADMSAGRVNNAGKKTAAPPRSIVTPITASAPPPPDTHGGNAQARREEVNRIIYDQIWKIIGFTKRARSFLRRKKDSMNNFKRTILRPFS